MIKIEKTDKEKSEGFLEMRGTVREILAETILIMRTLAQRLEAETGIPAADHIAGMAQVATDDRFIDCFYQVIHEQPGVNLGSVLWKWGNGDEP